MNGRKKLEEPEMAAHKNCARENGVTELKNGEIISSLRSCIKREKENLN